MAHFCTQRGRVALAGARCRVLGIRVCTFSSDSPPSAPNPQAEFARHLNKLANHRYFHKEDWCSALFQAVSVVSRTSVTSVALVLNAIARCPQKREIINYKGEEHRSPAATDSKGGYDVATSLPTGLSPSSPISQLLFVATRAYSARALKLLKRMNSFQLAMVANSWNRIGVLNKTYCDEIKKEFLKKSRSANTHSLCNIIHALKDDPSFVQESKIQKLIVEKMMLLKVKDIVQILSVFHLARYRDTDLLHLITRRIQDQVQFMDAADIAQICRCYAGLGAHENVLFNVLAQRLLLVSRTSELYSIGVILEAYSSTRTDSWLAVFDCLCKEVPRAMRHDKDINKDTIVQERPRFKTSVNTSGELSIQLPVRINTGLDPISFNRIVRACCRVGYIDMENCIGPLMRWFSKRLELFSCMELSVVCSLLARLSQAHTVYYSKPIDRCINPCEEADMAGKYDKYFHSLPSSFSQFSEDQALKTPRFYTFLGHPRSNDISFTALLPPKSNLPAFGLDEMRQTQGRSGFFKRLVDIQSAEILGTPRSLGSTTEDAERETLIGRVYLDELDGWWGRLENELLRRLSESRDGRRTGIFDPTSTDSPDPDDEGSKSTYRLDESLIRCLYSSYAACQRVNMEALNSISQFVLESCKYEVLSDWSSLSLLSVLGSLAKLNISDPPLIQLLVTALERYWWELSLPQLAEAANILWTITGSVPDSLKDQIAIQLDIRDKDQRPKQWQLASTPFPNPISTKDASLPSTSSKGADTSDDKRQAETNFKRTTATCLSGAHNVLPSLYLLIPLVLPALSTSKEFAYLTGTTEVDGELVPERRETATSHSARSLWRDSTVVHYCRWYYNFAAFYKSGMKPGKAAELRVLTLSRTSYRQMLKERKQMSDVLIKNACKELYLIDDQSVSSDVLERLTLLLTCLKLLDLSAFDNFLKCFFAPFNSAHRDQSDEGLTAHRRILTTVANTVPRMYFDMLGEIPGADGLARSFVIEHLPAVTKPACKPSTNPTRFPGVADVTCRSLKPTAATAGPAAVAKPSSTRVLDGASLGKTSVPTGTVGDCALLVESEVGSTNYSSPQGRKFTENQGSYVDRTVPKWLRGYRTSPLDPIIRAGSSPSVTAPPSVARSTHNLLEAFTRLGVLPVMTCVKLDAIEADLVIPRNRLELFAARHTNSRIKAEGSSDGDRYVGIFLAATEFATTDVSKSRGEKNRETELRAEGMVFWEQPNHSVDRTGKAREDNPWLQARCMLLAARRKKFMVYCIDAATFDLCPNEFDLVVNAYTDIMDMGYHTQITEEDFRTEGFSRELNVQQEMAAVRGSRHSSRQQTKVPTRPATANPDEPVMEADTLCESELRSWLRLKETVLREREYTPCDEYEFRATILLKTILTSLP